LGFRVCGDVLRPGNEGALLLSHGVGVRGSGVAWGEVLTMLVACFGQGAREDWGGFQVWSGIPSGSFWCTCIPSSCRIYQLYCLPPWHNVPPTVFRRPLPHLLPLPPWHLQRLPSKAAVLHPVPSRDILRGSTRYLCCSMYCLPCYCQVHCQQWCYQTCGVHR
jgi:hypothetical protein